MDGDLHNAPAPVIGHSVFMVDTDNVAALWPHWLPLLNRALIGCETYDAADVRRLVEEQRAQLWIQWGDDERLESFIVTELVEYPQGRWLRLWLCATDPDRRHDDDAFYDPMSEFQTANDCRGWEVIGRVGWLKRFPELRFVAALLRTG